MNNRESLWPYHIHLLINLPLHCTSRHNDRRAEVRRLRPRPKYQKCEMSDSFPTCVRVGKESLKVICNALGNICLNETYQFSWPVFFPVTTLGILPNQLERSNIHINKFYIILHLWLFCNFNINGLNIIIIN